MLPMASVKQPMNDKIREKASANHMAHMAEGVKFARILVRYILYEQFCPEFEPAKCHFSLFYLHTHFTNGEEQQAGTIYLSIYPIYLSIYLSILSI